MHIFLNVNFFVLQQFIYFMRLYFQIAFCLSLKLTVSQVIANVYYLLNTEILYFLLFICFCYSNSLFLVILPRFYPKLKLCVSLVWHFHIVNYARIYYDSKLIRINDITVFSIQLVFLRTILIGIWMWFCRCRLSL